jgi:hypothetical protein
LLCAGGAGDEAAYVVDDQEHRIGQLGTCPTRAGAQLDQKAFEPVGEAADPHHAHHAGGPFHRVRLAKNFIDRGLIVGGRLEHEQAGRDAFEVTLGFLDEERSELVF